VNLPANFASMSVDELWEIHEEISKLLEAKMLAEKKLLERRLFDLHPATQRRRSTTTTN
jgi:DNA-binding protein H-NS